MKFAWVDAIRSEASPKARGKCPQCEGPVIAKCGQHVVWHWAHQQLIHCDPWWESETEWHRTWKNRFPADWQEYGMVDMRTGERHIADIRTGAGLVIELQHSSIEVAEVQAREAFYRPMIWIVDGCKNDADRFNFSNMRSRIDGSGLVNFAWFGRSKLFERWHTTTPVFIDFGADHGFWRILRFDRKTKRGVAGVVGVDAFVELASSGTTDFSKGGGPASASA